MKNAAQNAWRTVKIDDVCDLMTGGTPSRTKPEYFDGDIKWLVSGDIHKGEITDCEGRITDHGLANSNARILPVNSVIIALNGQGKTRGTVAMLRTEATCNQSLVSIMPKDTSTLLPEYIFMNLRGRYEEIRRMTGDAGNERRGLNMRLIREIEIPLAPINEQQRIVAVLDEAFEGLARARTHAEANLQNARDLFETSLNAFIDRHKESWNSTNLGEAYDVRDGTHDSPKYHPAGHALITSKNLGRDGLHFEKVKYISKKDYDSIRKRSGVDKGDVLFAMIGTIGNPIVVDVDPDFAIKNVALFKMKGGRSGQFLRYMLRSKQVVEKMQAEAKGTTQQFVGLGYLRSFPIILPEPTMELNLVDELDRIETQCRSAESLYDIKLQDIDDLRQSLLQKAFAGELT